MVAPPATFCFSLRMQDLTIQQQGNSHTFAGRNDRLFQALSSNLTRSASAPLKILSFGCSTGEECLDLARIIPEARIYGADIKLTALQKAQAICPPDITLFRSTDSAIREHGPYDAITAMSVFCLWPSTQNMDNISPAYPFKAFESGLAQLTANLKVGGILLLQNAQYMIEDLEISAELEPIQIFDVESSGWIFKCRKDGTRVTNPMIEYDCKIWDAQEFIRAHRDHMLLPADQRKLAVNHVWTDESLSSRRNVDIALWKKVA